MSAKRKRNMITFLHAVAVGVLFGAASSYSLLLAVAFVCVSAGVFVRGLVEGYWVRQDEVLEILNGERKK